MTSTFISMETIIINLRDLQSQPFPISLYPNRIQKYHFLKIPPIPPTQEIHLNWNSPPPTDFLIVSLFPFTLIVASQIHFYAIPILSQVQYPRFFFLLYSKLTHVFPAYHSAIIYNNKRTLASRHNRRCHINSSSRSRREKCGHSTWAATKNETRLDST